MKHLIKLYPPLLYSNIFHFSHKVSHETLTIRYNSYTFFLINITKNFFFYFHITHFKSNVSHETNKQNKKKYIYTQL